ncbi:hypothetical protein DASC09_036300 [Saccharomycopsis crataegensis]|uniref:Uncharacterized protein n=1 Tax=Saccharomycopsis crataegensis TaxID=43959 RepID=A0AAV5QPS4_9ASCO|nr:hypothetical protein DASC09_036300 [Saccharomycopsis crataegensis]
MIDYNEAVNDELNQYLLAQKRTSLKFLYSSCVETTTCGMLRRLCLHCSADKHIYLLHHAAMSSYPPKNG